MDMSIGKSIDEIQSFKILLFISNILIFNKTKNIQ